MAGGVVDFSIYNDQQKQLRNVVFAGTFYGWIWMDPAMGIVGALVIARWSWGLIKDAGAVLLDTSQRTSIFRLKSGRQSKGRATGLPTFTYGRSDLVITRPIVALVSDDPQPPSLYKSKLSHIHQLSHLTVEVKPGQLQRGPKGLAGEEALQ